jgi:cytochrome c-type biogenesis protein CcmE
VRFTVTDTAASIPVVYKGILPDFSKKDAAAWRRARSALTACFKRIRLLAKHDENYMPPEAGQAIDKAKHAREAAKTVVDN